MGSSTISQTDSLEVKRALSAVAFLGLSFLRTVRFSGGTIEEFCLRIMLNINDWNIRNNIISNRFQSDYAPYSYFYLCFFPISFQFIFFLH